MQKLTILFFSILFLIACGQNKSGYLSIDAIQFNQKLENTKNVQLIDVRTPEEYANSKIGDALNLNYYDADFEAQLKKLDTNKPLFVYCKSGGRSSGAVAQILDLGFTEVYELQGGIMAWERAKLQTNKNDKTLSKDSFTKNSLNKILTENQKVIVNFYASWCIPCKRMKPFMDELEKEHPNVKMVRIDIDQAKALAAELKVENIPTVMFYEKNSLKEQKNSEMTKSEIENWIRKY
jgi:thioredoxin